MSNLLTYLDILFLTFWTFEHVSNIALYCPLTFKETFPFQGSSALIVYAVLQNFNLLIVKLDGLLIGTLNQLTTLVLAVSKALINEVFNDLKSKAV